MRDTSYEKDTESSLGLKASGEVTEKNGITGKKSWRSRMGIIMRTSPLTKPGRKNSVSYRPNPDDVKQWAQSMDNLLSSKYGMVAFQMFMKSEFCEENIEFWLACEEFRQITSSKKRTAKAKSIYKKFIESQAPKEINLDFQTKEAILQSLHNSTQSSFILAQSKVYNLMENNSYPRFLDSQIYIQLCQLAQGTAKESKAWE
ncbi:regulator of G-protein signaling 2 [Hoplias malabaricus]|uniref:regulator of G-protein signaling 2 n=1 Tax=Hoplias malabaricus TaxID=27720 RepID=UPI003463075E